MNSGFLTRVLRSCQLNQGSKTRLKLGSNSQTSKGLPLRSSALCGPKRQFTATKTFSSISYRPCFPNQVRSYCTKTTQTEVKSQEKTIQKIADTWIKQEHNEDYKRALQRIFGQLKHDGESESDLQTTLSETKADDASTESKRPKDAAICEINPKHSKPSDEELLSMQVFAVSKFYAQIEERQPQASLALKQALSLNPFLSEAWYTLGTQHMMNRSPDAAIEALEKCISISPKYVPPYSDLASIYILLKQYAKAVNYCQKALDLNGEFTPALYNKALGHQMLEEWKDAIKCYEKIVLLSDRDRKVIEKSLPGAEFVPQVNFTRVVHGLAQCYASAESSTPRIDQAPKHFFLKKSLDLLHGYLSDHEKDDFAQCLLGCAYGDMGKLAAAIDAFNAALDANPENLDAHVNLGMLYFSQQNFDQSLKHLEHALDQDPSIYMLHLNKAHVHRMRGEPQDAVRHYLKAIELNPKTSSEAHLYLGILLFNQNQYAACKPHLDEALRHFPQSIELHYHLALYYKLIMNNFVAARTHFEVAYRLTLASLPASQRLCFKLLDEGNYPAFNQALVRELTDNSHVSELYSTVNGSYDDNMPSLLQGHTSTGPLAFPSLCINTASLLSEIGRNADAVRIYQGLLQANPRYVPAHFNLAKSYEAINVTNKAIEHFMMATECDPKFFEAKLHLGILLSANGEYDKALTYLKEAVQLNRFSAAAWHALADCEVELGQYRTAQQSYSHVTRLNPTESDAHVGIGVCFFHLQRYRDAEMSYRQALNISNDTNPLAFYNMSSTLMALHRTEEAIDALEKSLQLDPDFSNAHMDLALTLAESNDKDAKKIQYHLNQAIQLDPSQIERVPQGLKRLISQAPASL